MVIEACQKRTGRKFNATEIEAGILKDLLIEEDYNIIKQVNPTDLTNDSY